MSPNCRRLPASLLLISATAATAAAQPVTGPAAAGAGQRAADLRAPVRLESAGGVIDTEIGHAGPFVGDFDDDGVNDLLVGQFGGGVLWIYKNVGTNAAPKLAAGVKFQDGRAEGTVPTG
jgi:hypothetical protein